MDNCRTLSSLVIIAILDKKKIVLYAVIQFKNDSTLIRMDVHTVFFLYINHLYGSLGYGLVTHPDNAFLNLTNNVSSTIRLFISNNIMFA